MSNGTQKIAILGGGPAGLGAAVALANSKSETGGDRHVELFEATGRLGGRVATFVDRPSGVTLDTCQHVLMGCCTATLDFFRTLGLLDRFTVYDRYHFFDATGRRHDFGAARLLPAPLHLLPGFWRLKYLTRTDRLRIIRSLRRLEKLTPEACAGRTAGDWLRDEGHSPDACRRFWA
ncbi:MAG: FAD-dependent oxidoreductase, partial [Planctomycetia bacterium]